MRSCPVCRNRFPTGANFCPHDGQALVPVPEGDRRAEDERFVGATLDGRYQIEARIGQGGMGVVYAARHVMIDKPVAIKLLRPEYCRKPGLVERFVREARAASQIGHPNIVDVTDFGKLADGQVFLVMEHLFGDTLAVEIRRLDERIERMPMSRVIDLSTQICNGLSAAHGKGIIHRDLKPENIFIVNPKNDTIIQEESGYRTDFVKLLDFGIARFTVESARITQMGSVFGTPQYMSPEQAAGQDADHRGDIYALGCIVYEMVIGRPPFLSDTFMGTLTKQMYEPPISPRQIRRDESIPPALEATILKMLAKRPADRFQSMAEVATALNQCFVKGPVAVAPPESTEPPGATEPVSLADRGSKTRGGRPKRQSAGSRAAWRWGLTLGALVFGGLLVVAVALHGAVHEGGRIGSVDDGGMEQGAPDMAASPGAMVRRQGWAGRVIQIESVPPGAEIWCDGRRRGSTPAAIVIAADRPCVLVLRKLGYRARRLQLGHGESGPIRVSLQKVQAGEKDDQDTVLLGDAPPKSDDLRSPFPEP